MGKKHKKDKKKDKKDKDKKAKAEAPASAQTQADAYEYEVHPPNTVRLKDVDLKAKVADKDEAEKRITRLQKELYALSVQAYLKKRPVILVFEGWDAAGKGGAIKRLTALMDPRGYKVWPIAAPSELEREHHFLWRFQTRMPARGEIAIFDRSWYGRVLVERIEGFCDKAAWRRAFDEINAFERTLTADGVAMAKFWLHIDRDEQLERFKAREKDPLKQWKIGEEDWRNRKKWDDYEEAAQEMFDRTHRPDAPWHLISANDKKHARIAVLESCREVLEKAIS